MRDFQNFKFQFPLPGDSNSDSLRWGKRWEDEDKEGKAIGEIMSIILKGVGSRHFNQITHYCFREKN